jgi:hypothetical protein
LQTLTLLVDETETNNRILKIFQIQLLNLKIIQLLKIITNHEPVPSSQINVNDDFVFDQNDQSVSLFSFISLISNYITS